MENEAATIAWNNFDRFNQNKIKKNSTEYIEAIDNEISMWIHRRSMLINPITQQPYGAPMQAGVHICTEKDCVEYIETISKPLKLYGCLWSGNTHVCYKDREFCRWRYDRHFEEHCVFSKEQLGVAIRQPYYEYDPTHLSNIEFLVQIHDVPDARIKARKWIKMTYSSKKDITKSTTKETDAKTPTINKWKRVQMSTIDTDGIILPENRWAGKRRRVGAHRHASGMSRKEQNEVERLAHIISTPLVIYNDNKINDVDNNCGGDDDNENRDDWNGNDIIYQDSERMTHPRDMEDHYISIEMEHVVCDDLRKGNAFKMFCEELHECAECILNVCVEASWLRKIGIETIQDKMKEDVKMQIKDYVTGVTDQGIMPNFHIMDNIHDSFLNEKQRKIHSLGQTFAVERKEKSKMIELSLILWLSLTISISAYPFISSKRGVLVADTILNPTKEGKHLWSRLTGNIQYASYMTCFRRFVVGYIRNMAGLNALPDVQYLRDQLDLFHPQVKESLPSNDTFQLISDTAGRVAFKNHEGSKGSRGKRPSKRFGKNLGSAQAHDLEIIQNGKLFCKDSLKEADLIFNYALSSIELAKLENTVLDIWKQPHTRHLCPYRSLLRHYAKMPTL